MAESCPVCGANMRVINDDLRQEWERITYLCGKCDEEHTRVITFKTQSNMVESDVWDLVAKRTAVPFYICMYYNDGDGENPIVKILEVKEGTEPFSAIAVFMIEERDWEIEDVVETKDRFSYFRLDPKAVAQLQNIEWPENFVQGWSLAGTPSTILDAEVKLAVYKAFEIEEVSGGGPEILEE